MNNPTKLYLVLIFGGAALILGDAAMNSTVRASGSYATLLALAWLAATWTVRPPEAAATVSASFVFVVLAMMQLSVLEALLLGGSAAALERRWRAKIPGHLALFHAAAQVIAIGAALAVTRSVAELLSVESALPQMACAASVLYIIRLALLSGIASLSEQKTFASLWQTALLWSFPYCMALAAIAALIHACRPQGGGGTEILLLPVLYMLHHYYGVVVRRLGPGVADLPAC